MKKHYGQLVKCCVPKLLLDDYYAYIDKYNQFQYAAGTGRRSMRSPSYRPFMEQVFLLLQTYRGLGFYRVSVADYLKEQLSKEELDRIFNGLNAFLDEHGMLEYRDLMGEECLLCNGLRRTQREDGTGPAHECYPFPKLWREFYDAWVKTPQVLWNMCFAVLPGMGPQQIENYGLYAAYEKKLLSGLSGYELPDSKYAQNGHWSNTFMTVLNIICSMVSASVPDNVAKQAILYITQEIPEEALWYDTVKDTRRYRMEEKRSFVHAPKVNQLVEAVGEWKDNRAFEEMFWLYLRLDQKFAFCKGEEKRSVYGGGRDNMLLTMADYVKVYTLGLIEADCVYDAAFEKSGVRDAVNQLGVLMKEKLSPYEKKRYRAFLPEGEPDPESPAVAAGNRFYLRIVDTILDVELKRGDSPTVFLESIFAIRRIYGAERLIAILTALGKDSLDRKTYYGFYERSDGKRECLSHLLQVCWPDKSDSSERLAELLKGSGIREERLIETAMKKNEEVLAISEFKKKLKEQYSRTVKMFEEGMEEREAYSFRELYVKLPEEADKEVSLMFAGNQIQPRKTAACLKGRRWIADVEALTLEYVVFSDRKTFRRMKIGDVLDTVYSEVMRDVDQAVSVAHASGADLETSHSTVEMRRVIAQFNAELFGLKNISFEKNHAIIEGSRAKYSIHLGSGVIHQLGAHQINVLPVHSQSGGKIFLPFLDEDPKTAEIMSKILLFAQDNKIKDPYILDQISG